MAQHRALASAQALPECLSFAEQLAEIQGNLVGESNVGIIIEFWVCLVAMHCEVTFSVLTAC